MWLEKLARFGCATKGLVYFTIGLLALRLAFGISSQTTNSKGALKFIGYSSSTDMRFTYSHFTILMLRKGVKKVNI